MHTSTLVSAALLGGFQAVSAYPGMLAQAQSGLAARAAPYPRSNAVDFTQWTPAGPGDLRSPCPALNSLANHGILPHDGRGIGFEMLKTALADSLNIAADISLLLFVGAQRLGDTASGPAGTYFDLDMLNHHNAIEHDASLSRADYGDNGNNFSFNQTVFDSYMSGYAGLNTTTYATAGKARMARVAAEKATDPQFTFQFKQQLVSNAETALMMSVLGGWDTGMIPLNWLHVFFEQERFPFNEGWRTPTHQLNLIGMNVMMVKIGLASSEILQNGGSFSIASLLGAFGQHNGD